MSMEKPIPLLDNQMANDMLPYNKDAIQRWARFHFPEQFSRLPAVETLSFKTMDERAARKARNI